MIQKRKQRRNRKYLGSRSHGTGNVKNKRGSGSRGGVGRAGMHKHKFSFATTYDREWMAHGGRRGFANPTHKKIAAINIYEIQNMAQKGKLGKGALKLSFCGKILGTGELTHAVEVSAFYATKSAIARIEKAGGKFISLPRGPEGQKA
jgi:large subunit ribosomal protein L15